MHGQEQLLIDCEEISIVIYNVDNNRFSFVPTPTRVDREKLWQLFLIERKMDAFRKSNSAVRYLFIEPYRSCNLKCSYCYAKTQEDKRVDSNAVAKLIKANQFEEVLIFGGEPFLSPKGNNGIVREVLDLLKEDTRLAISSNGINIDVTEEIIEKTKKNLSLQISVEPTQWGSRLDNAGRHQNDLLVKGKFSEIPVYFRVTIPTTAVHVPLREVIAQIAEIKGNFNFNITYWAENGNELNHELLEKWIQESIVLFNSEERQKYANKLVWQWWTGRLINMFKNKKRFEYANCNAAIESVAIGPDSSIYGCHEKAIVSDSLHKITTVEDRMRLVKSYIDNSLLEECANCRIRYFCGSVCFVHEHKGSCKFLQKTFEAFLPYMDWYLHRDLIAFYEHSKGLKRTLINSISRQQIDRLMPFATGQLPLYDDLRIAEELIQQEAAYDKAREIERTQG